MINRRHSFASATLNQGQQFVVIGGYSDGNSLTDKCEYYKVTEDEWVPLPKLQGKNKKNLCCVNVDDCYIYSFSVSQYQEFEYIEVERLNFHNILIS